MSKADGDETRFDLEALRKRVSETGDADNQAQRPKEPVELNPLAKQVANQLRGASHSPDLVIGQLRLFEFVVLTVIAVAINSIELPDALGSRAALAALCVWGAGFCAMLLQISDTYQLPTLRRPLAMTGRIQGSLLFSFTITALLMVMLVPDGGYSWQDFGLWYGLSAAFLFIERTLVGFAIRHWGRNGVMERRAVIVGGGQAAKDLIRSLEQHDNDIRICGIFDDRKSARSPDVVAGYPKLGTFAELVEFARLTKLDMLIISLPMSAEARILELLRQLWVLPVDIRIAAHANKLRFRPRSYSHIGSVPMLDVMDKPLRDWDAVAKRVFDIIFSVICILILWPLMLAAAIAVKVTSKGPVLFKQKRHGFNNETINVWKFRSRR